MKKRRSSMYQIIALLCLFVFPVQAYAISADDFLPPVQAQSAEKKTELLAVKDEGTVKTEVDPVLKERITTAATAQDAINKIISKPHHGCEMIGLADGGLGFVATGVGTYNSNMENVVASRIAQRNAYVKAFMDAKVEMAKTVGGYVLRGANDFDKKPDSLDNEKIGLVNFEEQLTETQKEAVSKVLRGYVTYHVQDVPEKGSVYVTIVSTPKTRGVYNRPSPNALTAESLNDGLNVLLSEITNGLVSPVGGRIIEVPGTGELAFVGFGSSVVRKHDLPDIQAELDLQAEQIAGMRASDALLGIIDGDNTKYAAGSDEQTLNMQKEFERQQLDDPTMGDAGGTRRLDQRVREYKNTQTMKNVIQSLRRGALPPGISRKTWMDEDEYFAYGVALYVPSISDLAAQAAREMDDAQLLKPVKKPGAEKPAGDVPGKSAPKLEMKKGPSGVVSQDVL